MTRRAIAIVLVLLAHRLYAQDPAPPTVEKLSAPTFGDVVVYVPGEPSGPVVLLVSGDGGWNLGVIPMAERLSSLGALVVGIDIRTFVKSLEASPACAYPAGPLEELSRAIQIRQKLPAYRPPILAGYSSGATLVYAALAAAPPETFSGAISLGFCPDLETRASLCPMRGLKATKKAKGVGFDLAPFPELTVPWMVLQGQIDKVCSPAKTRAFVAATGSARLFSLPNVGHGFSVPRNWEPQFLEAYREIADAASGMERSEKRSVLEAGDLPLVELPVPQGVLPRGRMAVVLSGDGGWAEIDRTLAEGLAAAGVATVGWNSLRYYWSPRTPEAASADLERILTHYSSAWNAPEVLLVGYSFGADVLPFLVNRLSPKARAQVGSVALLGLSANASFEFHVADWFGGARAPSYPTVPEVERLEIPVTCVQGKEESDSPCTALSGRKGSRVTAVRVGSGHHFSGDYERLVAILLQSP